MAPHDADAVDPSATPTTISPARSVLPASPAAVTAQPIALSTPPVLDLSPARKQASPPPINGVPFHTPATTSLTPHHHHHQLYKPTLVRILLSAIKAWSTGYATGVVPAIVGLVLKHIKGRPLSALPQGVWQVLVKGLRNRMPWFFMALIGGFRALDRGCVEVTQLVQRIQSKGEGGFKDVAPIDIAKAMESDTGVAIASAQAVVLRDAKTPLPKPLHHDADTFAPSTFIAATVSSALALLVVKPAQRVDFAMFTVVRALDSLASFHGKDIRRRMREKGVPELVIDNGDSVVFIACATQIIFCWLYFPQALPAAYVKWISQMSHFDPRLLEAVRLLGLGTMKYGVETGHGALLGPYCESLGVPYGAGNPANGFIPCTLIHPQSTNCTTHLVNSVFRQGFGDAARIYVPVHLLPAILFHPRRFVDHPVRTVKQVTLAVTRSATFLALFICGVWAPICLLRNATRRDSMVGPALGSLLCGFSILVERKSRRREIGLYCVPKAAAAAWWMVRNGRVTGKVAGKVPRLPGMDVVAFALGMGYLLTAFQGNPNALRPAVRGVLGFFLV
ncbi:hypothetical protein HKX48_007460 [Thoreauomyces humboldtii]|nr:hypothetical protein HKX48_007460 [Thoreauomyces humboldtii]